jgi:formate dehydrogenase major subunit
LRKVELEGRTPSGLAVHPDVAAVLFDDAKHLGSRWFDGVMEEKANIAQKDNIRAAVFMGHAVNSQTRNVELKAALEKLELLVIADPFPSHAAVLGERSDGVYLLPAATQYETYGSVTSSNRSVQWREQIIEPLFEALPDHTILYKFAKKLGFAEPMFKNIKVDNDEPLIEDVLREINRGSWTIGYTGQSPERLKDHLKYRDSFDSTTLQATDGPLKGEYYGLPWPCWGTADMKHPGTPILYDTSKPVAEGGLPFRARWGVEHEGVSLLAENSYTQGSEVFRSRQLIYKDWNPKRSSLLGKGINLNYKSGSF